MIRQAKQKDYRRLVNSINSGKKVDYITATQLKQDLKNQELFVLEDCGKLVAIFSIVYDNQFKSHYIKRLKVLNRKNLGKGYASRIIEYVSRLPHKVSATPWEDNQAVRHLLEKFGFELVKKFNQVWCLYQT